MPARRSRHNVDCERRTISAERQCGVRSGVRFDFATGTNAIRPSSVRSCGRYGGWVKHRRLARASFVYVLAIVGNTVVVVSVVLFGAVAALGEEVPSAAWILLAALALVAVAYRLLRSGVWIVDDHLVIRTATRSFDVTSEQVRLVGFRSVWFTGAASSRVPALVLTTDRLVKLTPVLGRSPDLNSALAGQIGEWAGGVRVASVGWTRATLRRDE